MRCQSKLRRNTMTLEAERACADGNMSPNVLALCLIFVFVAYIFGDSALTAYIIIRRQHFESAIIQPEPGESTAPLQL